MKYFRNTGTRGKEGFTIDESAREPYCPALSCSAERPFFRYAVIENIPSGGAQPPSVSGHADPGNYRAFTISCPEKRVFSPLFEKSVYRTGEWSLSFSSKLSPSPGSLKTRENL